MNGDFSYRELYRLQGCRCFFCRRPLVLAPFAVKARPSGYTIDHVFPRMLGYTRQHGKVMACHNCNQKKATRLPTEIELARLEILAKRVAIQPTATPINPATGEAA